MSEDLVTGQLSEEWFQKKDVTWKILNFFAAPMTHSVSSPSFSFANASWCLRMYPNGRPNEGSNGWIEFTLVRLQSDVSDLTIFYRFIILTKRNLYYDSIDGKLYFSEKWKGMAQIVCKDRVKLKCDRHRIASDGTVTVLFQVSVKEDIVEQSCHAEPTWRPGSLLQDYKKLFLNEVDSDMTIVVNGLRVPAHRNILRVRCPVFEEKFRGEWKGKSTVEVDDHDTDVFLDLLRFLYAGGVEKLTVKNVFGIYATAGKYGVRDLKLECLQFMQRNLSPDTFCDIFTFCCQHSEMELSEMVTCYFVKHFRNIVVTPKWQKFMTENPLPVNDLLKSVAAGKPVIENFFRSEIKEGNEDGLNTL